MAKKPALIVMARDPEQYPAPHTADVHPDEVENWRGAGFVETGKKSAAQDEPAEEPAAE